jgi:hypothetical protein
MQTSASASPQVNDVTGSSLTVTVPSAGAEMTPGALARFIRDEITRVNGPQLPVQQETEIITGFFERYGAKSVKIARYAFGTLGGMWRGAPVTVRRFAPGQDDYFAEPILREIGA